MQIRLLSTADRASLPNPAAAEVPPSLDHRCDCRHAYCANTRRSHELGHAVHTFPIKGTIEDFCRWLEGLDFDGIWLSSETGGGGYGTGYPAPWVAEMFGNQAKLPKAQRLTAAHIHFFPEDVVRGARTTLRPIALSTDQSTKGRRHIPWPTRALAQINGSPSTSCTATQKKQRGCSQHTLLSPTSRGPPKQRGTPPPPPPLAATLDQHIQRGTPPPPLAAAPGEHMKAGPGKGNFAKLENYPPGYHFACAADIARLLRLSREHATQCAGTMYLRARCVSRKGFECSYQLQCDECSGDGAQWKWRVAPGANTLFGVARALTGAKQRPVQNALEVLLLQVPARSTCTKDGTFALAEAAVMAAGKASVAAALAEAVERGWVVIAFDATHDSQRGAKHTVCTGIDVVTGKIIFITTITEDKSEVREQLGLQRMLDQLQAIKGFCVMAVATDPCATSVKHVHMRARGDTELHHAILSLIDIWHKVKNLRKALSLKSKLVCALESAAVALVRLVEQEASEGGVQLTHKLMRECFTVATEAAGERWRAAFMDEQAAADAATTALSAQFLSGQASGKAIAAALDPARAKPAEVVLAAAHAKIVQLRAAKAGGAGATAAEKASAAATKARAAATKARAAANAKKTNTPRQRAAAEKAVAVAVEREATAAAAEVEAGAAVAAAVAAAGGVEGGGRGSSSSSSSSSSSDEGGDGGGVGLPSLASWRASKATQAELKAVIETLGGSVPPPRGGLRSDELRLALDKLWPACGAYTAGSSVANMLELAKVAVRKVVAAAGQVGASAAGGGGGAGVDVVAVLNETIGGSKVKHPKGATAFESVQDVKDRCKLTRGKRSVSSEQLSIAIRALGFDPTELANTDHGSLGSFLHSKLAGSVADEWASAAKPAAAAVAAQKGSLSRAIVRLARDTSLDFSQCSMRWKAWRVCEALAAAGPGHLSGDHSCCGSYSPYVACASVTCPHGSKDWTPKLDPWLGDEPQSELSRFCYALLVRSTAVVGCVQSVVLSPVQTSCVESFNNCLHLRSSKSSHRGNKLYETSSFATVLDFHEQKEAKVLGLGRLCTSKTHPGGIWRAEQDLGHHQMREWQMREIEGISKVWAKGSDDPLAHLFVEHVAACGRADDARRAKARARREAFVERSDTATRARAAAGEMELPAPKQRVELSADNELVVEEVEWARDRKQPPLPLKQLRRAPNRD
jgi:hypothetical protein